MKISRGFFGGFLVLGFAIFIVGLLVGMMAVDFVSLKLDPVALLTIFTLGFLTGLLTVALVLVSVKMLELRKTA
ncbi:MAG: hypothetical protein QXG11_03325 [Candidatus Bathyarchaeia archaeon]